MKRIIVFLAIILSISITSCSKEKVETTAIISVKENSVLKEGVSVYMFKKSKSPNSSFFKPFHADKTIITDANGDATFKLKETFDLEIIDEQTTLYFGVFNNNDVVLGETAITIEIGQSITKNLEF